MSCTPYDIYIMKHMDGELNDPERVKLMQHIAECSECKKEFDEFNSIKSVLELENIVEPPDNFQSVVMQKIDSLKMYGKKIKERNLMIMYFITSMGLTLMLIAVSVLFRNNLLNIMVEFDLPLPIVYGVYEFLTKIATGIKLLQYLTDGMTEYYYILVGLFSIVVMSKIYEANNNNRINEQNEA